MKRSDAIKTKLEALGKDADAATREAWERAYQDAQDSEPGPRTRRKEA